jgi:hypothetical protein
LHANFFPGAPGQVVPGQVVDKSAFKLDHIRVVFGRWGVNAVAAGDSRVLHQIKEHFMMGMNWVAMLLTMSLGGNDLLDMVNTKDYWESKGVTVSVGSMLNELSPADAGIPDASELIKQLGDKSSQVRQRATGKLASMGAAVLPQLKKALASPDPEIATRAKQIIAKLTSGGPNAAAIRRLMAIRTLGELKDTKALEGLKKFQDSQEPFVAQYVGRAIANIEGKPYSRPIPSDADMKKDLAALPKSCGAVAQARMVYEPAAVNDILDSITKFDPRESAGAMDEKDLSKEILDLVEAAGNVRLDAITIGIAGKVGPNEGFIVLVGRGQFDPAALETCRLAEQKARIARFDAMGLPASHPARLSAMGAASQPFDRGVEVIPLWGEGCVMFTGKERAAIVIDAHGGPRQPPGRSTQPAARPATGPAVEREDPMTAVSRALAADKGEGGVLDNADMAKLLAGVDMSKPLWAAVTVTESYRTSPMLAGFKNIVITGQYKDHSLTASLKGAATTAEEGQASVAAINNGVSVAKAELTEVMQYIGQAEFFKGFVEALGSVELKGQDLVVTGAAKLDKPQRLLQLPVTVTARELQEQGRYMATSQP